jgi:hypothetical protein
VHIPLIDNPPPAGYIYSMRANVSLLIPFDLGLELDFTGKDAKEIVREVSERPTPPLSFRGKSFEGARLTASLYRFGVGLIDLSFQAEGEMDFLALLSCRTEEISVGKTPVAAWAKGLEDGLLARARKYATYDYQRRMEELDLFPVFVFEKGVVESAPAFLEKNRKALYGLVAGEPNYDALSEFVLGEEKLINLGYYENEVILIKRFGAAVSSAESKTVLEIIRLALSLHWSLRAYNFFLDRELDHAQSLLDHIPPWYKAWLMPRSYQMFSREALDFVKDKLSIVDSLYNVSRQIPRIESDWHLRTIFKNVEKEFDIDDLSKTVEVKLERIEDSYATAREFLSTNFFIAVEIILLLSFAWMVLDTTLLFIIAKK